MGLSVSGLHLTRGARLLLADLSFEVPDGEALMLRGPNGVGKTTLLRAIAGLGRIDGGSVRFRGVDHADRDAWSDQAIYAAHADAVKASLSVAENLAFWARIYGGSADAALDAFDLGGIADRLAGNCSAGQRRRLGLARLLVANRPMWLLDEPSVSLDAASVTALMAAISGHLESGGVAVIASHDAVAPAGARTVALSAPREAAHARTNPFLEGTF